MERKKLTEFERKLSTMSASQQQSFVDELQEIRNMATALLQRVEDFGNDRSGQPSEMQSPSFSIGGNESGRNTGIQQRRATLTKQRSSEYSIIHEESDESLSASSSDLQQSEQQQVGLSPQLPEPGAVQAQQTADFGSFNLVRARAQSEWSLGREDFSSILDCRSSTQEKQMSSQTLQQSSLSVYHLPEETTQSDQQRLQTFEKMKRSGEDTPQLESDNESPSPLNSVNDLLDVLTQGTQLRLNGKTFQVNFRDLKKKETVRSTSELSFRESINMDELEETKTVPAPNQLSRLTMNKMFSDKVRNESLRLEEEKKLHRSSTLRPQLQFGSRIPHDGQEDERMSPLQRSSGSMCSSDEDEQNDRPKLPYFNNESGHIAGNEVSFYDSGGFSSSLSQQMTYQSPDRTKGQEGPQTLQAGAPMKIENRAQDRFSGITALSAIDKMEMTKTQSEMQMYRELSFYHSPRQSQKSSRNSKRDSRSDQELKVEDSCEESKQHTPNRSIEQNSMDAFYERMQNQISKELEEKEILKKLKKVKKPKQKRPPEVSPSLEEIDTVFDQQTIFEASSARDQQNPPLSMVQSKPRKPSLKLKKKKQPQAKGSDQSLPIIHEEHDEASRRQSFQDESAFGSSSHLSDNTCLSQVNVLPHLKRDETQILSSSICDANNTKGSPLRFIFDLASAFKLNPSDLLETPRNPAIYISSLEETKDREGFTAEVNKISRENSEELNELRNLIRQFQAYNGRSKAIHRKFSNNLPAVQNSTFQTTPNSLKSQSTKNLLELSQKPRRMLRSKAKTMDLDLSLIPKQEGRQYDSEMTKLKIQVSILSLALRQSLENTKQMELDIKEHMNKQTDLINKHEQRVKGHEIQVRQHEKKVKMFMTNLEKQKKQLHFAYLFACPLVLSFGQIEHEKYKLIPKLDYEKEYLKIKSRLEASQCAIAITKRQATIESFRQVLMCKPIGIHFSGHGILNTYETVGDYHELHKDEGDFLLFETDEGDSQLVSRAQLKKLLSTSDAKLDFVFVASCHSEFVGRIFLEAGSKHVICIDHKFEVDDNAVHTFTEAFYDAIFSNSANICKAFKSAQVIVNISHNETQANIFKLLVNESLKENHDFLTPKKHDSFEFGCEEMDTKSNLTFGGLGEGSIKSKGDSSGGSKQKGNGELKIDARKIVLQRSNTNNVDDSRKKEHHCVNFGNFPKGMYNEVNQVEPTLQIGSIDQPIFVARQKDMFKLIVKILSPKSSRLLTLLGLPGIGKSSLARKTLQHINERALLPGGYIMLNVRGIKHSEVFMREFNNCLLAKDTGSFSLFGFANEQIAAQHDSFAITNLILEKIASMQRKTLLVIDNAEDLIGCDKGNFKNLVQYFLSKAPSLRILLTTRCRLKIQSELNEEIILLYGLPTLQSMQLFTQLSRQLTVREINELLKTKPDVRKYPSEKNAPAPKKLQDHHLFRMLGGNPATIAILAPMLTDQDRAMDLVALYKTLCADTLQTDADPMVALMRSSVHISLQSMQTSEPECLELLFLLAMLPGGILPKDLDLLWKAFIEAKTELRKHASSVCAGDQSFISAIEDESYHFLQDFKWRRAFLKLRKQRLIKEKRENTESKQLESEEDYRADWMENTLLCLPEMVKSFAEAQITQTIYEQFTSVLAGYFKREFSKIYERNQNQILDTGDPKFLKTQIINKINKLQKNFLEFISRLVELQPSNSNVELTVLESSESDSDLSDESPIFLRRSRADIFRSLSTPKRRVNVGQSPSPQRLGLSLQKHINDKTAKNSRLLKRPSIRLEFGNENELSKMEPKERAKQRWKTAFLKIKEMLHRQKLTSLKLHGTEEMEEVSDFEEDVEKAELTQNQIIANWKKNLFAQKNLTGPSPRSIRRADTQFQPRRSTEVKKIDNRLRFGSIHKPKLTMSKNGSLINAKQDKFINFQTELTAAMEDDELAIIYYVANLILLEQYSLAHSIIEKQLLKLKEATNTFKGNVWRMQGLCELQMLKTHCKKGKFDRDQSAAKETEAKVHKIIQCFKQAANAFSKEDRNNWGLALTYYQHAEVLYFAQQVHSEQAETKSAISSPIDRHMSLISYSALSVSSEKTPKLLGFATFGNKSIKIKEERKSMFIDKAFKYVEDSMNLFKSINHPRGQALACKLHYEMKKFHKSLKIETPEIGRALSSQGSDTQSKASNQMETQYLRHMAEFRTQQRRLPVGDMRQELCITRIQGETISLNVEIVRGIPDANGIFRIESPTESPDQDSSSPTSSSKYSGTSIRITCSDAPEQSFRVSKKPIRFLNQNELPSSCIAESPNFAKGRRGDQRSPKNDLGVVRDLSFQLNPVNLIESPSREIKLRLKPLSSSSDGSDSYHSENADSDEVEGFCSPTMSLSSLNLFQGSSLANKQARSMSMTENLRMSFNSAALPSTLQATKSMKFNS